MKQLAQNILDIAMNSVRAGATRIAIEIREDTQMHTLEIAVEDNGCGMSPEMVARVSDPFCTTRKTRSVGLGIPLFKMEAEMTGGRFAIESREGIGTRVSAFFHTDSIDCLPLGDVAETVLTLVGAAPSADVVLRHEKDGSQLHFCTQDMRTELGDVPLDTPEVLLWIRDYLTELYRSL